MIKMHYKKAGIALAAAGVLVAVGALADNTASNKAQMIQDNQAARQEQRTQNVCDRIAQFSENLNQKASGEENRIKTRQQERLTNWENKTETADGKMAQLRSQWEANRQEQFQKLEGAAKTDDQKKAVNAFEETVKAAVATRQAAVDKAVEAFRAGVKSAIQTRQGQVDSIVSDSASARKAALDKAQADCSAGEDAATVRADFQAAMKNSRTQMQDDRQNVTKISATVQNLIQTRQKAVKDALDTFKATMEQARTSLKKSFPDQTTDTSSINTESTATK